MGVSNYTPTGISHATSVDFSKRSVNQPVHIVQYDRTLPILAVSLYNNGQLYRLSETMEVSIRLGKPDRTFVCNKALGCDSTRTIVYFEITQQMSLFDGEYYPVIEIKDGEKIANSSTIYLVVDRNPVQHDYIESTIEYKELIDYRDEAVKSGNEAKEAAKVAKESAQIVADKTKEAVEASETAVNAANSASASAESILGVEENVTRIGNMVSEKEPIITAAAETASTSAINAKQSETNAKASEEASKLSENNAKVSESKAKASEEASKLSETNAKDSENKAKKSENESVKYSNLAKSYAVGTDNTIRENDAEDNAKTYCEAAKTSAGNAKQSETNAKTYLDKIIAKVDVTVDTEMSDTSENPVQNKVIKKYVDEHTPEVSDMTGATATQNGAHGLVPAPQIGDEKKALLGDGTWGSVDAILTFKTKEEYDAAVANDEIPDGAKVIKEYDEGDSTTIIDVDTVMSDTSENPVQNKVIKKYVDEHTPEVADMTGATAEANGTSGTVPAPTAGQESHILNGDGTWASPLDNAIISAKIEELNQAIENAKALKASLETYGMVQLNDTSVVTDSTGLALPATEKNPNLEGTLANQISQLNTDPKRSVISFLDGIKGYFIKHNVCSSVVISSSTGDNIVYPTIKISRSVIGSQFLAHASFKQMARFGTEYCDGQALIIYPEDSLYKSRVQYSARHSSSYEFVTGYYDDDYIYIRFANPKGFIKIEISVCTQFYWYDPETFDWLNENVSVTYMKDVTGFTQIPLTVL